MVKIRIIDDDKPKDDTIIFVIKDDTNAREVIRLLKKANPNIFLFSKVNIIDKNGVSIKPNQQILDSDEVYVQKVPFEIPNESTIMDFCSLMNIKADENFDNKNSIVLEIPLNEHFMKKKISEISMKNFLHEQYGFKTHISFKQDIDGNSLNYVLKIRIFCKSFNIILKGNYQNKQSLEALILAECQDIIKQIRDPEIALYSISRNEPPVLIGTEYIDISCLDFINCVFISHGVVYHTLPAQQNHENKSDNISEFVQNILPSQEFVNYFVNELGFDELKIVATFLASHERLRDYDSFLNRLLDWSKKDLNFIVKQGLANAMRIQPTDPKLKDAADEVIRTGKIERGIIMLKSTSGGNVFRDGVNKFASEAENIESKPSFIQRQNSSSYPYYDQLLELCKSKEEANAYVEYFHDDMAIIQKLAELNLVKK